MSMCAWRFCTRKLPGSCRRFSRLMTDSAAPKRPRMSDDRSQRIIWVDLEMTGLDLEKERIIEMACLVTDADLNIVAEAPNLIINQPSEILDNMGEWCLKHHGESGLTKAVRESHISQDEAEEKMLGFIREHTDSGKNPLAGNSIHMDRMYLSRYMPRFTDHLHYRIIDVSTIKELSRRWFPKEYQNVPRKKCSHRALDDIKESIEELRYYQKNVFKNST